MFVFRILRIVLRIPPPRITREEAVTIAKDFCSKHDWEMNRPTVVEELRTWLVWVDGNVKGSPWVVIDQQTGDVVKSGVPPL